MTQAQVNYILTTKSLPRTAWLTLEGVFKYILMNSDKVIAYFPQSAQFWFSNNGYLLIRNTKGNPVLKDGSIPAGFVSIPHDEKEYLVQIEPGGVIDQSVENAGVFHDIISYDSVSGMYFQ